MKEKEMDNLTRCSIAAQKAGMSYGKYMAAKESSPEVQDPDCDPAKIRICQNCGRPFSMIGRYPTSKYCSEECRRAVDRKRCAKRYREKRRQHEQSV